MANTIGDMIDQLTIANIRVWMLEDQRREYTETDQTKTEEEVKNFLRKVSQTNRERNNLIDNINNALDVLTGEKEAIILSREDLIGTGKNKFYKKEDKD